MSNKNVNTTVRKVAIEYAGLGSKPYFIISDDKGTRFIPIERGVTQLQDLLIDV